MGRQPAARTTASTASFVRRPHDALRREAGEYPSPVDTVLVQGGAAEVVQDRDRRILRKAPDRDDVQSRVLEPPVQVLAERALWHPADRTPGGQRGVRHGSEFGGDLDRGVAAADHHDPMPGERVGAAVVGCVQHPPRELRPPGQVKDVRAAIGSRAVRRGSGRPGVPHRRGPRTATAPARRWPTVRHGRDAVEGAPERPGNAAGDRVCRWPSGRR